jgi:hypothetical protein
MSNNNRSRSITVVKSISARERIVSGVERLVTTKGGWTGSMQELDAAITREYRGRVPADWPVSPRGLRSGVDRVVRKLSRLGIKTRFGRRPGHDRKRFVEFAVRSSK